MGEDNADFKEDYIKDIGVGFLDTFIKRLYTEPYQVIREYLSNAVDAFATQISIDCTGPDYDTLIIKDDGIGIKDLNELKDALALMMSIKKDATLARRHPPIGYFGIGFFSGGKICNEIEIRTTSKDSDILVEAKIPMGEWLKAFESKDARYKSLFSVTRYEKREKIDPKFKSEHYTWVILHGLKEEFKTTFFDEEKRKQLIENISRIVPVDYDPNMNIYITEIIPDRVDELEIKNGTKIFKEWLKEILEDRMAQNGIPFTCRYNNVNIDFNGSPIYRPYPIGGSEKEPLDSKEAWKFKEFKVKKKDGEEKLIGIGWAVIRGARFTTSLRAKEPIQFGGNFSTEALRGIQIRLFNVEIISFTGVYGLFGVKVSSQPLGHIWGEVYLFDEDIEIDPKRENLVKEGFTKKVSEEIKSWIIEVLKYEEDRRHDKTHWKKVIDKAEKMDSITVDLIEKIKTNFQNYRDDLKNSFSVFDDIIKKDLKKHVEDIKSVLKEMEKGYGKIKTLNTVRDTLESIIKDKKKESADIVKRLDNYTNAVFSLIIKRIEALRIKEQKDDDLEEAGEKKDDDLEEAGEKKDDDLEEAGEIKDDDLEEAGEKKDDDLEEAGEEKDDDEENEEEWVQFKRFIFPSYDLNVLETGLMSELIDIVDVFVKEKENRIDIINRISILLNEREVK